MFAYFYQICLVIFLLQGISLPILMIVSGALWWKQSQQLDSLRKALDIFQKIKSGSISELILKSLPKLKPLNCPNCGTGVLLKETETLCPNCETRGELPEDYAAAVSRKAEVKKLFKSAIRHWRVANILTLPLVSWIFFSLIFIEPLVLFPVALIGSNLFNNTWIDKAFVSLGETMSFLIVLCAFFGFVVWMIVFMLLTNLSKTLRNKLPLVPVFEGPQRGSETAGCQACGGGIEYDRGDFACMCSYCNVENFRVQFARRERIVGERQKAQTTSVFFSAMEILEDFVGMFFFLSIFLVGCPIIFGIFYAARLLLDL
jgi:Zn finger protein HypA/HybF involved in hydrogenase expression